jgi:excisionase family DNA binding protein
MSDTTAPVIDGVNPTALYTPRQVGEFIGVSKWTVHAMCARGDIRARRVGNRWKISGANVAEYVTGADNQPAADAS